MPSGYRIPFNRPSFTGEEQKYLEQALGAGQLSGDGMFSGKCAALLQQECGATKVLLTPSCTAALEMAALLLKLEPGDEVIVPSFTFVSTANAFALFGARIRFADIEPETFNIDPESVETLMTDRCRAIVPVHYAGVGCDMDRLGELAARSNAILIEDNAHGLFGARKGRPLGSFGPLSATSFHETKNFSCGEGGALFVNDESFVERAEILREKGTNRHRFFRGLIDKYTWVDLGSSYLMAEPLAALLYAQLSSRTQILEARRAIWERYADALGDWAAARGIRLPHIPCDSRLTYHIFYLLLPDLDARERLRAHLAESGILSVFHYLPLHSSPGGLQFGNGSDCCPITEDVSVRLLRLPLFADLQSDEQNQVIEAILKWE